MQGLQIFNNEEFGQVRSVIIDGEPWFVGKDVAEALGYESPRSAVSKKVESEDRGVADMETPSGKQEMTIINESGLYALIFGSKLETAKMFKRWVTSEVLPALHKNGTYSVTTTCQYPVSAAAMESATNAGRLIERIMKAEGAYPHEIAFVVRSIFQQAGIDILDTFVKLPAYEQMALNFGDIVTR